MSLDMNEAIAQIMTSLDFMKNDIKEIKTELKDIRTGYVTKDEFSAIREFVKENRIKYEGLNSKVISLSAGISTGIAIIVFILERFLSK